MTQPAVLLTNRLLLLYQSSIGKKLLTGITGLTLALFVTVHMLANLTLFFSPAAYNQFGHVVEQLWPLTYLIELVLALGVILHASLGIQIWRTKRRARREAYAVYLSAGQATENPSYQNLSSRSMVVSGIVLGVFLVWHLLTFKFGLRYAVSGTEMRDLARLVIETFQQPLYTVSYVTVFGLLALHLRHGLWSAWQSLGALNRHLRPLAYSLSLAMAVLLALGFGALPLAIYFGLLSQ
ncbi:MAG: succinate dehydrogenase cytochrome b subunit [Synechococcales cyanobacterium RM1_1_8]|nr:succinate dehydrogenase cytochrome b subunit [Synechococcales cyanobacterium RM1_1_8]